MREILCMMDVDKIRGDEIKTLILSRYIEILCCLEIDMEMSQDMSFYGKILLLEVASDASKLESCGVTEGMTKGIPPEAILEYRIGGDRVYEIIYLANNEFCYHVFAERRIAEAIEGWHHLLALYGAPATGIQP